MLKTKTKKITTTAIMAAMASILMYLDFPLPLFPAFLKLDFGDIPAIVCSFAIGPVWGVAVELIKNIAHMLVSQTAFVGEAANFIVGAALVFSAGLIYRKKHTKKGAFAALAVGIICMAAAGIAANFFIIIPTYYPTMETAATVSLVLYGITPFNLVKGAIISLITLVIYKPLSPILHR